jgi:glycosyltransferase involved in cell wall biosynthesis
METQFYYPGVTLLITHYNRWKSLDRLLTKLNELKCKFDDIVVSDDASKPEVQQQLQALQSKYGFRLVTAPVNKGFANNINKGQDAVKTPYTLYIQEDFVPSDLFPEKMVDALQIMDKRTDVDYIRFWAAYRYPVLKKYDKGFAETVFKPLTLNHHSFFMYSDNPHIRRSNFLQKFGRYQEEIDGNISEHNMAIRFIQRKGKGLFYEEYSTLFDHKNDNDEPSSFSRAGWRSSQHPFWVSLRSVYLKYKWMKCMWQVKFMQ